MSIGTRSEDGTLGVVYNVINHKNAVHICIWTREFTE